MTTREYIIKLLQDAGMCDESIAQVINRFDVSNLDTEELDVEGLKQRVIAEVRAWVINGMPAQLRCGLFAFTVSTQTTQVTEPTPDLTQHADESKS